MNVAEADLILWLAIAAIGAVITVIGILILMGILGALPEGAAKSSVKSVPKAANAKPASAPASFGSTPLARAMNKASAMVSDKSASGRITGPQAASFMSRISAFEPRIGKDEDAALVGLSQLMGAIAKA